MLFWFFAIQQLKSVITTCICISLPFWASLHQQSHPSGSSQDFPESPVDEESASNAGYPGWIPGLGRSSVEGIGYPFQNSWAFLVAQQVKKKKKKNLPAMWETWVWSLGWEVPLAIHSSILAWRIPGTVQSMGLQRVRHDWETFTFTYV